MILWTRNKTVAMVASVSLSEEDSFVQWCGLSLAWFFLDLCALLFLFGWSLDGMRSCFIRTALICPERTGLLLPLLTIVAHLEHGGGRHELALGLFVLLGVQWCAKRMVVTRFARRCLVGGAYCCYLLCLGAGGLIVLGPYTLIRFCSMLGMSIVLVK